MPVSIINGRAVRAHSITIVLLNYDGGDALERCLGALARLDELPDELLFVDNGSRDYDPGAVAAMLGGRFRSSLRFIRLDRNVGYAQGMNRGLEDVLARSTTEWVMTLSNDTELSPDF